MEGYLYLGGFYEAAKRFPEAAAALREGLAVAPENPRLHFRLGTVLDKMGERQECIREMEKAIAAPRQDYSPYAPRLLAIKINPEKIGAVIGPGGKVVRSIQDETGVTIDVQEDGTVYIAATNEASAEAARARIEGAGRLPDTNQRACCDASAQLGSCPGVGGAAACGGRAFCAAAVEAYKNKPAPRVKTSNQVLNIIFFLRSRISEQITR